MNKNKSRFTAVAVVCMLTLSLAACNKSKDQNSNMTVVNNTDKAGESVTSPVTYPEKDSNGNIITMVEVTDQDGKKVTDANGSVVTQVGVLNQSGALITDIKGSLVTPSLNNDTLPHIVATKPGNNASGNNQNNPSEEVKKVETGPTVHILNASDGSEKITGKPGDQIVVQLATDPNSGYCALYSWIDINTDVFEIVKSVAGDPTLSDYDDTSAYGGTTIKTFKKSDNASKYPSNKNKTDNFTTILCLFIDSQLQNITDKTTLATITLKIKDGVKAGEYDLGFDDIQDAGKSQCNYVEKDTKKVVSATPKFVNSKVTVQ